VREGSADSIRASLSRKDLAAARHRAALGALLRLEEHDVLAIQHLARAGELTPTQLGALLRFSSGGTTALLGRLERRRFVARLPHPDDRRSSLVRLTAEVERLAGDALAPLVADIDAAALALTAAERDVVDRFLQTVASAAERRAEELGRSADLDPVVAPAPPVVRLLS
jgi:DNA-binding MarR family transcriptional regulator